MDSERELPYAQWSIKYDGNMTRAPKANVAVADYHSKIGWGVTEYTVRSEVDGIEFNRRLDIANPSTLRGVEYKTGKQSASIDNLWQVERDKALQEDGWLITWVFRDQLPSKPLQEALDEAGIYYMLEY